MKDATFPSSSGQANITGVTALRVGAVSGLMAAGLAGGSEVFQLRNSDASKLLIVDRVSFDGAGSVAAFTAGVATFQLLVARSWSADGSGGTTLTLTGNNSKARTSQPASALTARIASTGALTAGTKTLDGTAVGNVASSFSATAGDKVAPYIMFDRTHQPNHPLILAPNEGIVLVATVPATGTWTFGLTVDCYTATSA